VICGWAPEKLQIAKRAIIFSHKKNLTLGSQDSLLKRKVWNDEHEMKHDLEEQIKQK